MDERLKLAACDHYFAAGRVRALRDALDEMGQGGVSAVQLHVLNRLYEAALADSDATWNVYQAAMNAPARR